MLSGAGRTMTYDGVNRLVEMEVATGTTNCFCSPDGDRLKTAVTPTSGPTDRVRGRHRRAPRRR
jgi:hypothetical protein